MKKFLLKRLIPIFCLLLSIVWVILAITSFGVWVNGNPGPGFFPAIVGTVLGLVSLVLLFDKNTKIPAFHKDSLFLLVAAIALYILIQIIGMLPSLLIFLLVWIRFFEKESWKTTLKIVISAGVFIYLVFVLWLQIWFPTGALFALFGF